MQHGGFTRNKSWVRIRSSRVSWLTINFTPVKNWEPSDLSLRFGHCRQQQTWTFHSQNPIQTNTVSGYQTKKRTPPSFFFEIFPTAISWGRTLSRFPCALSLSLSAEILKRSPFGCKPIITFPTFSLFLLTFSPHFFFLSRRKKEGKRLE